MVKLAPILKEVPEDIGMSDHEGSGSHDRQLHQALPFHGGSRIGPESIILKSEMANHNRGVSTELKERCFSMTFHSILFERPEDGMMLPMAKARGFMGKPSEVGWLR